MFRLSDMKDLNLAAKVGVVWCGDDWSCPTATCTFDQALFAPG